MTAKLGTPVGMLGLVSLAAMMYGCGPCKNSRERILEDSGEWKALGAPFLPTTDSTAGEMGVSFDILAADLSSFAGANVIVRDGTIESFDPRDGGIFFVRSENGAQVRVALPAEVPSLPADCEGHSVVVVGTVSTDSSELKARGLRVGP